MCLMWIGFATEAPSFKEDAQTKIDTFVKSEQLNPFSGASFCAMWQSFLVGP